MIRLPSDVRRRQIANAALKVITEQGLGSFTAAAVAARIGVTDGSLFRHFSTKDEIVLATLAHAEELLFDGFPPDGALPLERLELFFHKFAASGVARLAFSDELLHAAGPAGVARVEAWRARLHSFVIGCLDEARVLGHVPASLQSRPTALIALGTLVALSWQTKGGPILVDAVWATLAGTWSGAAPQLEQE